MTNISILKLSGAFHWVKTSRMRYWAFSYSIGDPCERSFQLIMYFIEPQFSLKSSERHVFEQKHCAIGLRLQVRSRDDEGGPLLLRKRAFAELPSGSVFDPKPTLRHRP